MASGLAEGLELRYVGSRFNGGTLPFDVLPDLSAFRDLITAIAKNLWIKEHPDRQRLPRGFAQGIDFDLVGIADGSAIPKIRWDRQRVAANSPELAATLSDVLDRSFIEAATLFDNAGRDVLPNALPADQIVALNRFGSSLIGTERIELLGQEDRQNNVVFLDAARRRKIVTKVRETYTAKHVGSGTLITSSSKGFITVSTVEFGELSFPIAAAIVEAHYDGNLGAEVQYEIMVERDANDYFKKIAEVLDISIVNASDDPGFIRAMARIKYLRGLPAGWLDGAGLAVSQNAVRCARALLDHRPELTIDAGISPTVEGGLMVELVRDGWDYSFEFLPTGEVDFFGVEVDGDGEIDPITYHNYEDVLTAFDGRAPVLEAQ